MQTRMDALEAGPAARPRRHRRTLAIAAALLAIAAIAVPVGVFANHQFTDVPTSNTFHGSIAKLKIAGITAGCSSTKYCPNDAVTRGQMAAFLNRAAPRGGSFKDTETPIHDDGWSDVATGTITTPGAGFIYVNVTATAYTNATTGCPCSVLLAIEVDGTSGDSFIFAETLDDSVDGVVYSLAAVSNTWMFPVSGAGTHTVAAQMYLVNGTASVDADAAMSVMWVPFDEGGDAWTSPASTTQDQGQAQPLANPR
jgi:hypothetical protein